MSDPLTAAANAINSASVNIRAFAQLAASRIEAVEARVSKLEGGTPPPPPPPPPPATAGPFTWEVAIMPLDPNSAQLVAAFMTYAFAKGKPIFDGSVGVGTTAPTDPGVHITAKETYAKLDATVYRPDALKPSTSSDHHLSILDPGRNRVHDLWEATPLSGKVTACTSGGSGTPDAVNIPGGGATAANTPLRSGLVWPYELASDDLDQPVAFSMPNVGGGLNRYPARAYKADYTGSGMVLGTLLRFPPTLVFPAMDKLSLHICKRIQRRGMFLRDASNYNLTFYGADIGGGGNAQPWKDAGLDTLKMFNGDVPGSYIPGAYLSAAVPWSKLQVLQPPVKP